MTLEDDRDDEGYFTGDGDGRGMLRHCTWHATHASSVVRGTAANSNCNGANGANDCWASGQLCLTSPELHGQLLMRRTQRR